MSSVFGSNPQPLLTGIRRCDPIATMNGICVAKALSRRVRLAANRRPEICGRSRACLSLNAIEQNLPRN